MYYNMQNINVNGVVMYSNNKLWNLPAGCQ